MTEQNESFEEASLPPGIKTEAVIMMLSNITAALNEICSGINNTVTQILAEGTKVQGELENAEQGE